jgi:WS/DGAT/MGAT family acyltransferase
MSKVDTAWLRMDSPTNRMMITGVMMFESHLDPVRLRQLIEERFLAFRRFRQKAEDTPSGASWVTDRDFRIDAHVRTARLPGRAGKRELERFVSDLASSPLDTSRPLWQFHVIERYGRGSALVTRIHHCYADGIALVQVLLSLTDTEATPARQAGLDKTWLREDRGAVGQRLGAPARAGIEQVVHLGGMALDKSRELLADPAHAMQLVGEGAEIARELAHALLLSEDPVTQFRGPLGPRKRCAWAEPLDLAEVKAVGKGLGCTVNDVLMASAAGALRSYLRDLGQEIDGLTIRATVPVNLRPLEHAKKLGNHFGLVFLELPIGEPNPLRRLERIAACMRELKRSRQAIVALGLLAALGVGPAALQRPALEMFSRKASAVATNVPGPQVPLYLAGARIVEQMFWVPQNGSIGMGISILSYNGKVHFGLMTDALRVPDPGDIIRRFAPEFEKLLLIALMEDWDGEITADGAAQTLRHYTKTAARPGKGGKRVPRRREAPSTVDTGFAGALQRFRTRTS